MAPKMAIRYDKHLVRSLGLHAVWEPGSSVSLGDVVTRKAGIFVDVGRLSDDGVTFRTEKSQTRSLNLTSQGVRTVLFQGQVQVPSPGDLKPAVAATLDIQFEKQQTYFLRTPELTGEEIGDLRVVGRKIAKLTDWRFADYYVVWKVLSAKSFTFLGSLKAKRSVTVSGSGAAIAKFLANGATVGITKAASVDMEIVGSGGAVALGVTRIAKNGQPRDV
jgi:hypothetical protein